METTIMGLYRDYIRAILGLYGDNGKMETTINIGIILVSRLML